jgi:hypothetical protein
VETLTLEWKAKTYRRLTQIFADQKANSSKQHFSQKPGGTARHITGDKQLTAVPAMRNLIPASLEELPVTAILASAL